MQYALIKTLLPIVVASSVNGMPSVLLSDAQRMERRQSAYDTEVEIGNGDVIAQDTNAVPPASPLAFAQLWDYLDGTICTAQGCSSEGFCVTAAVGQEVCISASGNFQREQRDAFVRGARSIFDRTVRKVSGEGAGVIETATNLIDFQAVAGDYSGFGIRVELSNAASGSDGCGTAVETIVGAGSMLPGVGSVFGLVGFFCDGVFAGEGMASG